MIVMDRSGSMRRVRRSDVIAFARNIESQINIGTGAHQSVAGLVTFADSVRTDQPLTSNRRQLEEAISNYPTRPAGATHLSAGLNAAKAQLLGYPATRYKRTIVLLSDGDQSNWYGGNAQAIRTANELKRAENGIEIFAFGFGNSVSRSTLNAIASQPHGAHVFYESTLPAIVARASPTPSAFALCPTVNGGTCAELVGRTDAKATMDRWCFELDKTQHDCSSYYAVNPNNGRVNICYAASAYRMCRSSPAPESCTSNTPPATGSPTAPAATTSLVAEAEACESWCEYISNNDPCTWSQCSGCPSCKAPAFGAMLP